MVLYSPSNPSILTQSQHTMTINKNSYHKFSSRKSDLKKEKKKKEEEPSEQLIP